MRILLFVLLSTGALAQPAMSPPPTPPFNAAMAPITTGQPGHLEVHPPRSPYKRVLPETPETRRRPGIWAGDEPGVVPERKPGDPIPSINTLLIPVPVAPEARDGFDTLPTEHCAHIVDEDIFKNGLWDRVMRLDVTRRECLASLLMFWCAEQSKHPSVISQHRIHWNVNAMNAWVGRACTKGDDEIARVLDLLGVRATPRKRDDPWTH